MVTRQDLYWTWEEALEALDDRGETLRAARAAE